MSLFSSSRSQTHHVQKTLNLCNNRCCDPGYTYIAQISQRGQQVTMTECRQHDENLSPVSHNTCPSSLTCCTRPPRPRSASPTSPTPCPGDHSISGLVMILFPGHVTYLWWWLAPASHNGLHVHCLMVILNRIFCERCFLCTTLLPHEAD